MTPLIAAAEVPTGKTVRVQAPDGRWFIACNDDGTYRVADCVCPHAGGPLAGAEVKDGCVVCPVHYWPWNLQTGLADDRFPQLRLRVYPCELHDGIVYADLPPARPAPDSPGSP